MTQRILITGCCGFIGTHVTTAFLNEGYTIDGIDNMSTANYDFFATEHTTRSVRVLPTEMGLVWENMAERHDKSDIVVFEGDFVDPFILRRIASGKYDAIIHLAAEPRIEYSIKYPVSTYKNNCQKTIELLHVCANADTKVVFASSAAVYGNTPTPSSESGVLKPASPYAIQKKHSEEIGLLFSDLYDLQFVALRFFNVYGRGQLGNSSYSTVIASWIDRLKNKSSLRLDGDGEQTRDYINVIDVAQACLAALRYEKSDIFNIASGTSISNNDVLNILASYIDITIENAPSRIGDIKHSLANVEKANKSLNFNSRIDIIAGLKELILA
jgi:UDP-glucose 4-epimerase